MIDFISSQRGRRKRNDRANGSGGAEETERRGRSSGTVGHAEGDQSQAAAFGQGGDVQGKTSRQESQGHLFYIKISLN